MEDKRTVGLCGIACDAGAAHLGARMGPEAMRVAGISSLLQGHHYHVKDYGDVEFLEISEMFDCYKPDSLYKPTNNFEYCKKVQFSAFDWSKLKCFLCYSSQKRSRGS